jgi:hypothetical protein
MIMRIGSDLRDWVANFFGWAIMLGIFLGAVETYGLGLTLSVIGLCGVLLWATKRISTAARVREERRLQAEPCEHGTVGGKRDRVRCFQCQREDATQRANDELARVAAEEKRLSQRREEYARWMAEVRTPEFLRQVDPYVFESIVCNLFRELGYDVKQTPASGDNGVDGFLYRNGQKTLLQCKRVKGSVGEPVLRDLFGSMHSCGASQGIVVTTGSVSRQARAWAKGKAIRIIELEELTDLIRDKLGEANVVPEWFAVDATSATTPDNCPWCGLTLRTIKGRRGRFQRCTGYPSCRFTKHVKRRHQ